MHSEREVIKNENGMTIYLLKCTMEYNLPIHFLLSSMYPTSHSQTLVSKLQLPFLASVQSSLSLQTGNKSEKSQISLPKENFTFHSTL